MDSADGGNARVITLTTDFGARDGYVGAMKGVFYVLQPAALIVDVTHEVSPQRIREGAFLLHIAYASFPPGTIHVAVVDPGVGTARRGICLDVPGVGRFVGPDNGLFSYVLGAHPALRAREIANPAYLLHPVSSTFHGRDVFAPVAAHLSRGEPFEAVGPELDAASLVRLDNLWPRWERDPAGSPCLHGEVVHVDRFGSLITNIPRSLFRTFAAAQLQEMRIEADQLRVRGIKETYGLGEPNELIALFGSSDFLEIARVNGRAARDERAGDGSEIVGAPVLVRSG